MILKWIAEYWNKRMRAGTIWFRAETGVGQLGTRQ
jgi:hypothetical protein